MRKTFLPVLFLFLTFSSLGQQKTLFNVSIGASIFTDNENDDAYYKLIGFPSLSIEKELYLRLSESLKLGIIPGINYTRFKEQYESSSSAMGGHDEKELNHSTLNAFSKLGLSVTVSKSKNTTVDGGLLGGFHIITKTKGSRNGSYMIDGPAEYYQEEINNNGDDFFRSGYFGFYVGLKPHIDAESRIRPAFELSYLPNYAKTYPEGGGFVQFSLLLCFNSIQNSE